jgi:hypothetical protein
MDGWANDLIFGKKKQQPQTADEEFLQLMRDRFAQAETAEAEIRVEAQKDIEFVAGEQWHPNIKKRREAEERPALVFNHLPTYVQQVTNEARQNKAQVKFGPVDSGSDIETADVMEGMARAIQRRSRADLAYETAIDYSASCSFGHFRMLTDYCSDDSFDQDIRFAPIYDPFAVYGTLIPACFGHKPKFALIIDSIPREEFKAQYPNSELVSVGFDAGSKLAEGWITDEIRIAEYWYTESKRRTFRRAQLQDGRRVKVYTDELEKDPQKYAGASYTLGSDGQPREREHDVDTIKSCLTNGVEILDNSTTTWLGKRIPIYTVLGRQVIVRGKPRLFSLVRWMRDPQQLLNIYKSGIAENIALANRVPYIGYKGQFKDPKWRNANTKNYPYLEAEPIAVGGQIAPLPQRQSYEPAIQALSVAAAQEIDDLKSIAGIFDASLGNRSNETSGIAIERRKQQSGLTNFHFIDNLTRAQTEAGEDLGYLIPRVYDGDREVKIIGEDETEKIVRVNAPYHDEKTGEQHSYLLDAGTYDVTVEVGPSHSTQRQEAAEQTAAVIQAAPQLMAVIGDILFRNSDNPAAGETAERLKKWISMQSPGLIEDDQAKKQPLPPQVQMQLQHSGQMIDQLTQQLNALTETVKTKKLELDSRERIEVARIGFEREKLEAQVLLQHEAMGSKEAIVRLQEELNLIRGQIERAHQVELGDQQAQYAAAAQSSDQAHQVQQQQLGHQQNLEQQQAAAEQQPEEGDEQLDQAA